MLGSLEAVLPAWREPGFVRLRCERL